LARCANVPDHFDVLIFLCLRTPCDTCVTGKNTGRRVAEEIAVHADRSTDQALGSQGVDKNGSSLGLY